MERTRKTRLTRVCAALVLLSLLSGCVAAAAAVPLMTAVGMFSEHRRNRAKALAALPAANTAALAVPQPEPDPAGPSIQLTSLTALPAPSGTLGTAWRSFATYTLNRAAAMAQGGEAASALLTPEGALRFQARTRPCRAPDPAVVIDLDPAGAVFVPASARPVAQDVADSVAQLRQAGVIILWVSQASANEVAGVADALKASGLDPTGRDPILLVRNEDERKQVLREEANTSVCILAMAGDRRSDFDELFDYLRDPALATAFDTQLGAGWFIVPPLFDAAAPAAVSAVAPAGEDGGR